MSPHARLVAALEALATKRAMDPLAALPVVSTEEFLRLVAQDDDVDDHTPALAYHPPLPARAPDWIDRRLSASAALFAHPLTTRAARRLYAAGMRHHTRKATARV